MLFYRHTAAVSQFRPAVGTVFDTGRLCCGQREKKMLLGCMELKK